MTKINLLPQRGVSCVKFYYFKAQVLLFWVVVGMGLLSWHIILQQKINVAVKYSSHLQQELNAVITQIHTNSNLKKQQQIEQRSTGHIVNLEQKRTNFVQIFEALHQGVSGNLYFTQVLIKGREVKMIGQTRTMLDLKQLITKLVAVKYGSNVPSIQRIIRQDNGYGFVLLWQC